MHCPQTVFAWRGPFWICRYDKADVDPKYLPWTERFNPLRFEVGLRTRWGRLDINKRGAANLVVRNFLFRLRNRQR